MPTIKTQTIDLINFCKEKGKAEKDALADRIFTVWSPLFPHVIEPGPSYMSTRYVEDPKGLYRHATFYLLDGTDRGLVIVRIYDQKAEGKPFLRLTVGAGIHAAMAGRDTTYLPVARAVVWALLRHPTAPIYLMDVVVSPGAWRSSYRWLPHLRPQPGAWIPDELWPVAQAGMQAIGAVPVEGKPRGVVQMRGFVSEEAKKRVTGASPESLRAEAEYHRWVGQGEGIFVCAQISAGSFVKGMLQGLLSRAQSRVFKARR